MTDHTTDRILYALYCFSRDTCEIDAGSLARSCGVSATHAADALLSLERTGLVDATRARLTMLGLARAVSLGARNGGAPAVDLRHMQPRMPLRAASVAATPAVVAVRDVDAIHAEPIDPFGRLETPSHSNGH